MLLKVALRPPMAWCYSTVGATVVNGASAQLIEVSDVDVLRGPWKRYASFAMPIQGQPIGAESCIAAPQTAKQSVLRALSNSERSG